MEDCARRCVLLKLTTDRHETSRGLFATANLLTLNSSKTEFFLIGLKQQLSKIHDSSLTTTHSVRNLGFTFDEHLTFPNYQLNRLLQIQNSLARAVLRLLNPHISLPFSNLSTGLRSMNA